MVYQVKEIFFTLQGEGAQAGSPAVFCRFTGCNLWSGREEDREHAACSFCDTDFVGTDGPGGGRFTGAPELAARLCDVWRSTAPSMEKALVVFTGGEPLLQLDDELIHACRDSGFRVALETNGTIAVPQSVDWICVSPKPGPPTVQRSGNELKLAFPQDEVNPRDFESLEFDHFFLQPIDNSASGSNLAEAIDYCKHHPRWRLSIQTHKLVGLP